MAFECCVHIKSEINEEDENQTFLLEEKYSYVSESSKELEDERFKVNIIQNNALNIEDSKPFINFLIKGALKTEDVSDTDKKIERNIVQNRLTIKTENKGRECEIYEENFTLDNELQNHPESDQKKYFPCNECGKSYSCKCENDFKAVSCQTCKSSLHKCVIKKSRNKHITKKPFSCETCGECFAQRGTLKLHQVKHTGEKLFSCNTCGKSFSLNCNLKKHQLVHTEKRPFLCGICGKSFRRKDDLKTHQHVHTGEKPFSCGTCGKSFSIKKNLDRHQLIHAEGSNMEKKYYFCEICNKSFSDLKKHRLTHTQEKPFSCMICGNGFAHKGDLRTHLFIHTGEKPYSCEMCGKRFNVKGHVKRHQVVHTRKKFV